MKSPRSPWDNFPDLIRNGEIGSLSIHQEYEAAKAGDDEAALSLVSRVITNELIIGLQKLIGGRRPILTPVLADEELGRNRIPLAFAVVLSEHLGLDWERGIYQATYVKRTNSGADHRLAYMPIFTGPVKAREYLIMDDTVTMGGTLASMRGYIEANGGRVIGGAVLSAHQGALRLPVNRTMLEAIERKHGPAMNQFWQEEFGYGIDRLTQGEAGHVRKAQNVDTIRARIIEARDDFERGMDGSGVEATKGRSRELEAKALKELTDEQLTRRYRQALDAEATKKQNQAKAIGRKVASRLTNQNEVLASLASNPPGLLAGATSKREWRAALDKTHVVIYKLSARAEYIDHLLDGSKNSKGRLRVMAEAKIRGKHPALASAMEALKALRREEQERHRQKKIKQRQARNPHTKGLSRKY